MRETLKSVRGWWRKRRFRRQLQLQRKTGQPIRLVLGSGLLAPGEGWMVSDQGTLDVTTDTDWRRNFPPGEIDALLAEHVWEHLSATDGLAGAHNCLRYLKPGGYFRVAVPDGCFPDADYIERVKVGVDGHLMLYTYRSLSELFVRAGFEVKLLEYFDEDGVFHARDWSPAQGTILRSRRFNPKNQEGELVYTSIILDAFRPVAN